LCEVNVNARLLPFRISGQNDFIWHLPLSYYKLHLFHPSFIGQPNNFTNRSKLKQTQRKFHARTFYDISLHMPGSTVENHGICRWGSSVPALKTKPTTSKIRNQPPERDHRVPGATRRTDLCVSATVHAIQTAVPTA
jgi:hypothetical protein